MTKLCKISMIGNTCLTMIFVGLLCLPITNMFFKWDPKIDLKEKRTLAAPPKFEVDSIKDFPEKIDNYFKDHFGFRSTLIYWYNLLKVKGLGVSSSDDVILGKQGWLFHTGAHIIEDYQGVFPFSELQLNLCRRAFEGKRDWLAQRGIHYLVVIPPNKVSIYPEFLPDHIKKIKKQTRLDQLITHLQENSDFKILDLRQAFKNSKKDRLLYLPHDTHWTYCGSFIGYQHIIHWISKWFPDIKPLKLNDFEITQSLKGGDLSAMLGLWKEMRQKHEKFTLKNNHALRADLVLKPEYSWPHWKGWDNPIAMENKDASNRLLVFNDSFSNKLLKKILPEHFARSVFIHKYPEYRLLKLMVEQEHPNIVIEELVERSLGAFTQPFLQE